MSYDVPSPRMTALPSHVDSVTWSKTVALIRSDFARVLEVTGRGSVAERLYWFCLPNYQAIFLYRIYRCLFVKQWKRTARLLCLFSLYKTGVDISPETSIGPGCLIGHGSVILCGRIGARFSIYGQGGTGGGIGGEDIGGGPGLPVVGDNVVFGVKAMALGPIRIGDRAKLAPGAIAISDIPNDAIVLSAPCKVITVRMGRSDS